MEDIYKFELDNDMFEKLLSGKKTAQLVINEPKRKVYAVGNQITFVRKVEEDDGEQQAEAEEKQVQTKNAKIENLLYFADVTEAVETLGKETCGFKHSATIEKASDIFLATGSYEAIEKNGIVALVFKVIE